MTTSTPIRQIAISKPHIGEEEKAAVMAVLDSGQLVQGSVVAEFEAAFAAYCGVKHAIASANGTTALTIALMAAGIKQGDEVIIPSFSFAATATSVLSASAVPVFADVEDQTFCLDPEKVEAAITPRTKAIMPVHLYGHPANLVALQKIADKHGLIVIEDAAQAHGAQICEQRVGSFGVGAFSFYPSKNMTTGEGGMTTTNDDEIARRARMIRQHGMSTTYYHEVIGYNFRMTNIHAAIGREQIKKLEGWNNARIANGTYLNQHLTRVRPPVISEGCRHVFHQYTVLVDETDDRDAMLKRLNERGIMARVYYPLPIHRQPIFLELGYGNVEVPVSEALTKRVMSIPVHPSLSQEDLEYMVDEVNAL